MTAATPPVSPQRILVTGGAGFIGSALVLHLVGVERRYVLNVDAMTYAASAESLASLATDPRYRHAATDITDRAALDQLFASFEPDAVMHLAAESHVDRSITGSAAFVHTNVNGTHVLLDAARAYWERQPSARRDAFRFLHVSTDEVFGTLEPDAFFVETSRYDPRSPYAATKAASDHLASAWHHTYGLPVVITNASNNYGPRQFPEKLIPLVLLNALEEKPLPVYGDGRQVRDWLYVEDHVRALVAALERGVVGRTYAVSGRAPLENIHVVETLCDLLDRHRPVATPRRRLITYVTDRPGHDRRYAIDPARIEGELGWSPQETFASGLDKTVRWYLNHEAWWQPLRKSVYAGARLGLPARGAAP